MTAEPRIIPIGGELSPDEPTAGNGRAAASRRGGANHPPKRSAGQRRDAVRRRFGLLNTFIDRAMPRLGRLQLRAWLLLYRHARPDGTVTASVRDLARRAGCCERSMRTALQSLQADGLIERIKRGTLAGGPSIWRLLRREMDADNRQEVAG